MCCVIVCDVHPLPFLDCLDHKFCFQIYWKSNTAKQGGRMKEMNKKPHIWAAWCSNACSHALFSQDESCGELSVCARFTFAAPYGRPSKGIHIRAVRNSCVSCGGFHVNLFKWTFKAGACSSREDEWVSFFLKKTLVCFFVSFTFCLLLHTERIMSPRKIKRKVRETDMYGSERSV